MFVGCVYRYVSVARARVCVCVGTGKCCGLSCEPLRSTLTTRLGCRQDANRTSSGVEISIDFYLASKAHLGLPRRELYSKLLLERKRRNKCLLPR